MNREIKFRGLRTDGKGWVCGYFWKNEVSDNCFIRLPISGMVWEVITESVGQHTGLKDKDGKEIYEGDVLSVKVFENNIFSLRDLSTEERHEMYEGLSLDQIKGDLRNEYLTDIKWEEDCFVLTSGKDDYDTCLGCLFGDMRRSQPVFDFEVIGNIHEHKHLINVL